jgi:Vesicle coat complex, various subunits
MARAIPAIVGALEHSISNLRKDAAAALGEIADAGALPYLEKALGDPDPEVRKNARWAIGRIEAA